MARLTLTLNKIDKISYKIRHSLANMILRDSSQYTPYKTGALERSATISNDAKKIHYNAHYAKFQWYGKLMLASNGSSWARRGEIKHLTNRNLKYNKTFHSKATSEWIKKSIEDNHTKWESELQDRIKKGDL